MRPIRSSLLTLALLAFAASAHAQDAYDQVEKQGEAKKHMEAGVAFMRDPDGANYEAAYEQFRIAHQMSGSLNALQNMGICAHKLERFGEAIDAYQKVLAEGKLSKEERAQLEQDLKALNGAVAWVTLSSMESSATVTDKRESSKGIVNVYKLTPDPNGKALAYTKIGVHPGVHNFTASVSGKPDRHWKIDVSSGQTLEHTFDFSKPDVQMHRPVPIAAWIVGGIAVGFGVAGGALLGVGFSKANEAVDLRQQKKVAEADKYENQAITFKAVGAVGLGLAGAGIVTSLVLIFTRPEVPMEQPKKAGWSVLPRFGLGLAGAGLLPEAGASAVMRW
jgi:tetratricopeptide (TPR) repeat protein